MFTDLQTTATHPRVGLWLLVAWACLWPASNAFALGADHSKEELERVGQLVKGQVPVHGYWVNWEDVFFYSGDTAALNSFLELYAKMENHRLKLVIHVGTKKARSPWDKEDRDIPADWSMYVWNGGTAEKPAPSQVDVWLGSRIRLEDLKVPSPIEVVSGGEIEKFVSERAPAKPEEPKEPAKK